MNATRVRFGRAIRSGILVVGMVSGCGYTTERPFPADIQSICVDMLHSKEFRRELEFELTEALVKRIEMETPYRVASCERADTAFTGEILEVQQRTIGTDFDIDLPRETGATIVMSWRWKDLRTGRILRERERFLFTTTYIPPVGEHFSTGMIRGMDGMAERIVEAMEKKW